MVVVIGGGRAIQARRPSRLPTLHWPRSASQPVVELAATDVVRAELRELQRGLPVSGSLRARQFRLREGAGARRTAGPRAARGRHRAGGPGDRAHRGPESRRGCSRRANRRTPPRRRSTSPNAASNNKALVDQGFISRSALDTSANNLAAAQATHSAGGGGPRAKGHGGHRAARPSPAWFRSGWRSRERVPIDGRVIEIVDLSRLELEATLTAADSVEVSVGQQALLQVEGSPRPVAARVVRINPSAQAAAACSPTSRWPIPACARACSRRGRWPSAARPRSPPLSAVRTDKPAPYVQVVEGQQGGAQTGADRRPRRGRGQLGGGAGPAAGRRGIRGHVGRCARARR